MEALRQLDSDSDNYDGLDIALCILNTNSGQCEFSGAHNSVYVVRDKKSFNSEQFCNNIGRLQISEYNDIVLADVKSDKMPVSVNIKMNSFSEVIINLKQDDIIYLFSDGFADQFNAVSGKKFMYKKFKELILKNSANSMIRQKSEFESVLKSWIGTGEQIDDITVLGIKI
jgi:serine phosphatase RsbU (regulator of sigma subunit)